jgi:dephospho-CoA kinase
VESTTGNLQHCLGQIYIFIKSTAVEYKIRTSLTTVITIGTYSTIENTAIDCNHQTIIDAIGLFEGALSELCDTTLAITAPEEVRISRLMARDGITENQAAARIHAQKKQDWFVAKCEHHLHNDGTMEAFRCKCIALYEKLGIIEK